MPSHAQIDPRRLPTINLGVVNNHKPYSLTTTIIDNAHPAPPPHYRHQRPPLPPIVNSCPQQPQHASTQQEHDKSATSPLKDKAATPHHCMNKRPPGAMLPTATWPPDDITHHPHYVHQPSTAHYEHDTPQHATRTPAGKQSRQHVATSLSATWQPDAMNDNLSFIVVILVSTQ